MKNYERYQLNKERLKMAKRDLETNDADIRDACRFWLRNDEVFGTDGDVPAIVTVLRRLCKRFDTLHKACDEFACGRITEKEFCESHAEIWEDIGL